MADHRKGFREGIILALLGAALLPAGAAAGPPSLDQYTITVPGAGGPKEVRQKPVVVEPALLDPATDEALRGPQDRALRRVAGSPALGATPVARRVELDAAPEGFVAGLGNTLGSGQALLLLCGLGLCTGVILLYARRSRDDGEPAS